MIDRPCFVRGRNTVLIRIHEAETELAGKDPFGAVKGGCIRCSGRLARIAVDAVPSSSSHPPFCTSKLVFPPPVSAGSLRVWKRLVPV
jgi:hypothetical protein